MKITLDEAIEILQKEIVWCLDNPDTTLNKDQQMGFMNGLRQAQYLLRAAEQKVAVDDGYCNCSHNVGWIMHSTHAECTFCHRHRR